MMYKTIIYLADVAPIRKSIKELEQETGSKMNILC